MKNAELPDKPMGLPNAIPSPAMSWLTRFCAGSLEDPGQGLALTGDHGIGKTTSAAHILRFAINNGSRESLGYSPETNVYPLRAGQFTPYYDFVRDQKIMWRLERAGLENGDDYLALEERVTAVTLESANRRWWAKLVVLDDVGTEYRSGTGWTQSELNGLLRLRHRYGYPTIITSNFSIQAGVDRVKQPGWASVYGEALGSFAREAFLEVPITGLDRRPL